MTRGRPSRRLTELERVPLGVDSETAHLLVVSTPAGLDRMFRACAVPAASATLPPPDAPAQTLAEIEEVLRLHEQDLTRRARSLEPRGEVHGGRS